MRQKKRSMRLRFFGVMLIERALNQAMAARRNRGVNAVGGEMLEDGVGIVSLVRAERFRVQALQQRQRLWAVTGLPVSRNRASEPKPSTRA